MSHPSSAPNAQILGELQAIIQAAPDSAREIVRQCVEVHAAELADHFYASLLGDAEAASFLNHDVVKQRLHAALMRWLREIYSNPHQDLQALIAHQRHVGEVHARIHLPIYLVTRGARLLKKRLFMLLQSSFGSNAELHHAFAYTGQLMDLSLELMSAAFIHGTEREARTDEAYRQHALGQNIAVERERQRSSLLEWSQTVLLNLHRQRQPMVLPRISTSEFGLWFIHKGASMFQGASETAEINDAMDRLDNALLPRLQAGKLSSDEMAQLFGDLEAEMDSIKFHLATLFEHQMEVENGRDTLTHLYNRRFLPSVINREIHLVKQHGENFALLLLDIDHFKQVNDTHGHEAGDLVLQQTAAVLINSVRSGDFVFRYGGEELLVLLVEVTPEVARQIAEKIRTRIQNTPFLLGNGGKLGITVSIGLAMFDGHPDQQFLIRRADDAMYQAKNTGRNRVCVG